MNRRLKIAVISEVDFNSRKRFAKSQKSGFFGASYTLLRNLELHSQELTFFKFKKEIIRILIRIYYRLTGRGDEPKLWSMGEFFPESAGNYFSKKINNSKSGFDLILCCEQPSMASYLNSEIPIAIVRDASIVTVIQEYGYKTSPGYITMGCKYEALAYEKASLIFLGSAWAVESAKVAYPEASDKFRVLHIGPSFSFETKRSEIEEWVAARPRHILNLLFVSGDWIRKGGDIVLETCRLIRERGIDVRLTLLGDGAPKALPDWAKNIGYISKELPENEKKISEIYRKAHFLFVPTRAEMFGLFSSEGNMHGVPVITTMVGGIGDAIKEGYNGFSLPFTAKADEYAQLIMNIFSNYDSYLELCHNSFSHYQDDLNWKTITEKFLQEVETLVK